MSRKESPATQVPPLAELMPEGRAAEISGPLVRWFRAARRDLPWRRDMSPYAVWVSESMLQQTQVATVVSYFERWMARFPTLEALAGADEDEVLHAWQGLGYYSRARSLLRAARMVRDELAGTIPADPTLLRKLPGVGPYTAGAIASIAYNVPAPIVDGNVIRVLTRLFALRGDPAREPLKRRLWELAAALIPTGEAREFNPAMMELGATICTPARPRCPECPVQHECRARELGIQEQLPETAARPATAAVRMVAAVIEDVGRVLLEQRRDDADRWAGMWDFPNGEVGERETPEAAVRGVVRAALGVEVVVGERLCVVRHAVTRFRITLEAFRCRIVAGEPQALGCREWRWVTPEEIPGLALPNAHWKISAALREPREQLGLRF
jgi:A/G-specific adenine glycosylase